MKVDSQGRIFRKAQGVHAARGWIRAETIINNSARGQVQSVVFVRIDNVFVSCTASRLVWLALKGKIPHFYVVTTKDGDKSNTHPRNLILCTHRESRQYAEQRAA